MEDQTLMAQLSEGVRKVAERMQIWTADFVMNSALLFSEQHVCKLKQFSEPRREVTCLVFTPLITPSIKQGSNVLGRQCKMHLEEMLHKHPPSN